VLRGLRSRAYLELFLGPRSDAVVRGEVGHLAVHVRLHGRRAESYYILLRDGGRGYLDSTEASTRWLLHLAEKRWFNRADFTAMVCRFISAGGPPAVRRQKSGHPTRLRLNTKTSPKVRLLPTLRVVEDPRP
jgi:hypothetical protein